MRASTRATIERYLSLQEARLGQVTTHSELDPAWSHLLQALLALLPVLKFALDDGGDDPSPSSGPDDRVLEWLSSQNTHLLIQQCLLANAEVALVYAPGRPYLQAVASRMTRIADPLSLARTAHVGSYADLALMCSLTRDTLEEVDLQLKTPTTPSFRQLATLLDGGGPIGSALANLASYYRGARLPP